MIRLICTATLLCCMHACMHACMRACVLWMDRARGPSEFGMLTSQFLASSMRTPHDWTGGQWHANLIISMHACVRSQSSSVVMQRRHCWAAARVAELSDSCHCNVCTNRLFSRGSLRARVCQCLQPTWLTHGQTNNITLTIARQQDSAMRCTSFGLRLVVG